jgi:hypothetical protein
MKKTTFNESVGKIHSLMERMGSNMTAYQATLNEEMCIAEASSKSRVQVSRDEILNLLDEADDAQNDTNRGLFATVTYVKPEDILKTKRSVDTDKLTGALGQYQDRGEEQWHKDLTAFSTAEKSNTPNPITAVITTTRYHLRWHSKQNYNADYAKYSDALKTLRMKNGVAIQSDGMLGDNHNQRQDFDSTGAVTQNQTGNIARDFNMAKLIGKPKSTAYIVDNTGHIVSEIPDEVMWSIHGKVSSRGGVEAEVKKQLADQPEALEAYAKAKAELDATFKARNLLFDRILCICCSVNGVSYYYINDQLVTAIAKKSEVNVNPQEMVNIAKEQLGESFDVMQGFAQ